MVAVAVVGVRHVIKEGERVRSDEGLAWACRASAKVRQALCKRFGMVRYGMVWYGMILVS